MTVGVETPFSQHNGDGITTAFAPGFSYASAADIVATVGGAASTWSLTGGNVVFVTAPPVGVNNVLIQRKTARSQQTTFGYNGAFSSSALAIGLDRLMRVSQEIGQASAQALAVPLGSSPPVVVLTSPGSDDMLGFSGSAIVNIPNAVTAATAQATIATNEATISIAQAAIATAQATIATAQAVIASSGGTTATAQAATATAQATIATAQATIATNEATIATAQAVIATAQAGYASAAGTAAVTAIGGKARVDGHGASISGTGATDTNTWLLKPLDCDCTLDTLTMNCITAGIGNMRYGLASVNLDGTNQQYHDFGTMVWSATGQQAFAYGGFQAAKGMRPFIRRMASNSGQFAYTGSAINSGMNDYYAGDLNSGAGAVAINASTTYISYELDYHEITKATNIRATAERDAAILGTYDGGVGDVQRNYLATGLIPGTAASTNATAYAPAKPIPNAGPLNAFKFYAVAAGFYTMHVLAPSDSTYVPGTVMLQATKYVSGAGWTQFTGGTDYDIPFVPRGTRVAISSAGAGVYYSYNTSGKGAYGYALPMRVGDAVRPTLATSISVMCIAVVEAPAITLQDKIRLNDEFVRGSTPITMQMFGGTSTPANWTLNGWTVNNGLVSPATGSATTTALCSLTYNTTEFSTDIDFTINTASTAIQFGLVGYQTYSGALIVNLTSGALELYNFNQTTITPLMANAVLTFATSMGSATGRKYNLTEKRSGHRFQAVLTDKATGETVTLATNTRGIQGQRMKGAQGLVFLGGSGSAGDVTVTRFTTAIGVSEHAKIAIFGDSIVEGAKQTDEAPESWAEIFRRKRNNGDVAIFATEGITAEQINAFLAAALTPFTQLQFVVLATGTNDANYATWQTQTAASIATIQAAGAQPVLCVPAPRAGYPTGSQAAYIRSGGFGAIPYIDLGAGVSPDGVNWYANMLLADGIHPTSLGAAAMAARVQIDAPYLMNGCYAGQIPVTD